MIHFPDHFPETLGVPGGAGLVVVVEIAEYRLAVFAPVEDFASPAFEDVVGIAALVGLGLRTVEADIGKVCSCFMRRLVLLVVVKSEGGIMLRKQVINVFAVPAFITELESVTVLR